MFRITASALAALTVGALALTGCSGAGASASGASPSAGGVSPSASGVSVSASGAGASASDLYKIGCPALDAVAASGSAVGKVAVTGLEKLRDTGKLSEENKQWVDGAIQFLQDPNKVDPAQKQKIIDGCAANGYPLTNVS